MSYEEHALTELTTIPDAWGRFYYAECACHNPDGDGLGRMDFFGATPNAVLAEWLEHYLEAVKSP